MGERKHRVTFRVEADLATALRKLPNQTLFVEAALRDALGRACPLCEGRGKVSASRLEISDFKKHALPRLSRLSATKLRAVVKLGQQLLATKLELASGRDDELDFRLLRRQEVLLRGRLDSSDPQLSVH